MRPPAIFPVSLATAVLLLAGCDAHHVPSDHAAPVQAYPVAGTAAPSAAPPLTGSQRAAGGSFLPYAPGLTAITYDPAVVPPGATARLTVATTARGTTVRLTVTGMVPRRSYGAHLHTRPCTAVPDRAGPHYQHRRDPKAAASPPPADPAYANPDNEVWLDFTADAQGAATSTATQNWMFDETQPPRVADPARAVHPYRKRGCRDGRAASGMPDPALALGRLGRRSLLSVRGGNV